MVKTARPYVYCVRCGAFSRSEGADRAKGLKEVCPGQLPAGGTATAGQKKKRQYVNKLAAERGPYTGIPLPADAPAEKAAR